MGVVEGCGVVDYVSEPVLSIISLGLLNKV